MWLKNNNIRVYYEFLHSYKNILDHNFIQHFSSNTNPTFHIKLSTRKYLPTLFLHFYNIMPRHFLWYQSICKELNPPSFRLFTNAISFVVLSSDVFHLTFNSFFFLQKCRFFLVVFLVKLLQAIYFQRHYLPLQLDMAYIISGGFASCKEKIRYSITRKRDYISLWFEDEWFAQQNQKRLESGFTIV